MCLSSAGSCVEENYQMLIELQFPPIHLDSRQSSQLRLHQPHLLHQPPTACVPSFQERPDGRFLQLLVDLQLSDQRRLVATAAWEYVH